MGKPNSLNWLENAPTIREKSSVFWPPREAYGRRLGNYWSRMSQLNWTTDNLGHMVCLFLKFDFYYFHGFYFTTIPSLSSIDTTWGKSKCETYLYACHFVLYLCLSVLYIYWNFNSEQITLLRGKRSEQSLLSKYLMKTKL